MLAGFNYHCIQQFTIIISDYRFRSQFLITIHDHRNEKKVVTLSYIQLGGAHHQLDLGLVFSHVGQNIVCSRVSTKKGKSSNPFVAGTGGRHKPPQR